MDNQKLLILTVKPSMEETISDWLISAEITDGFTSLSVSGHGSQMSGLSISEQVTGRKKQTQFRVVLKKDVIELLIKQLTSEFANSGIHYWVIPVEDSGLI